MKNLQNSMLANVLFSTCTGILFLLIPEAITGILDVDAVWILRLLGAGLLLFAWFVYKSARAQQLKSALTIIALDYAWVFGSSVLIIVNPFQISTSGNMLIGAIALCVLLLAVLQSIALRKLTTVSSAL